MTTPETGKDQAMNLPNYYRVMGLGQNATRVEIKEAYRRLRMTFSQGSAAMYSLISESEAEQQMAQLEEAYQILDDEARRREYDRKLNEKLGFASSAPAVDANGAQVVVTSRSTLAVIKTVVGGANNDNRQEQYSAIIASGDKGDGDMFKKLREAAGVSEDEMMARTKVSLEYLRAIEANRFERLPQTVYVKGFLRSCFRYLGVHQPEHLVEAFARRLDEWQHSQAKN